MAQNFLPDQQNTINQLSTACSLLLQALATIKNLQTFATDKGYTSGPNAITDAVVQGVIPSLVAADLVAALTTVTSIDTTLAASSRAGYIALEKVALK